jgi:hypothetical protein
MQWQSVQEAKIKIEAKETAGGNKAVTGTFNCLPLENVIAVKIMA